MATGVENSSQLFGFVGVAPNVVPLNVLTFANAQFDIIGRKTAGSGAWEDCTRADLNIAGTDLANTFSQTQTFTPTTQAVNIGSASSFDTANALNIQNASGVATNFSVKGDGANAVLSMQRFSADTTSATTNFVKARGSVASPGQVLASDDLGLLRFRGYDNSGTPTPRSASEIKSVAVSNVTATSAEGRIVFNNAVSGSVTPTENARIDQATGFSMFGANIVVDASRLLRRRLFTFGTLPAVADGAMAQITDGPAAPVWFAAAAGGGSTHTPVVADATTWRNG